MQEYEIYETETFLSIVETLNEKERLWITKMKEQIRKNPKTGKPLRFPWFREKKLENKRLYYLISLKFPRVLFIAFATKKEQQKIIDYILLHKDDYLDYLNQF